MQISEIDKNFEIQTQINKDDIEFFDIDSPPFEICGVLKENGIYRRMPEKVATNISEGVRELHMHTAGGRVRFATDSNYVAIYAKIDNPGRMPHFAFSGSAGLDLYADNEYAKTFVPPLNMDGKYEGIINFSSNTFREITINFPLYSGLGKLYVGLQKDSVVRSAKGYRNSKPVVFYGSSITQGGCASRPGMSYQSILSRRFNLDYVNLGFSGSAKAEEQMAEYIKNMDMSAFVYDYDYNAPSAEYLLKNHKMMFDVVREKHRDIPIIIMSRPMFVQTEEGRACLEVIRDTYNDAVARGDKNVYLVTGAELIELCGSEGTVDGVHPTDFGFASMAKALEKVFKKIEIQKGLTI